MKENIRRKASKYMKLTEEALGEIKIAEGLSAKEKRIAADFLEMARNYFSDGKYYTRQGDLLTALAAFSYAHAWLDAGVRAKFFSTENDRLFTLP